MKNKYEIRGDVTVIYLSSGKHGDKEALIDTCDLELVKSIDLTWCIKKHRGTFYAFCNHWTEGKKNVIRMHRMIMGFPGDVVDHINHNGLDNRRSVNLRVLKNYQNQQNRKGAQSNSKSGIRGVSWNSDRGKYVARFTIKGRTTQLGYFDEIQEAEEAIIKARRKYMPYSQETLSA